MKRLLCGVLAAFCAASFSACSINVNLNSQTETTAAQQSSETAAPETEADTKPTSVATAKADNYIKIARQEIWTAGGGSGECIQPEILLDSADAKAANAEIADVCAYIYDALGKGTDMSYVTKGVSYEAYLNGKTLSVVLIDKAANNNVIDYYVYNFDTDSGAKISDDELLSRAGTDKGSAQALLTDRVNEFFDEKIEEVGGAAPSDTFDEVRSYSVSDENLSQAKYYLADRNILMAVYRYRWVAGAEFYYNQTGVYPSLPQF